MSHNEDGEDANDWRDEVVEQSIVDACKMFDEIAAPADVVRASVISATPYVNTTVGTHTGPWMFEQALTCMKAGGRVRRKAWATDIEAQADWVTVSGSRLYTDDGHRWLPVAEDLLANDWEPVS